MLKVFECSKKVYHGFWKIAIQKRSFLSKAYWCEEAWNARLETPLLQKYKAEDLFLVLDNKYYTKQKVSALDIDIYANTISDKNQVQELLSILHNLRDSAETSNTLESTHYAVVRYLLSNNCTEELMNILHDRLKYGIFPDYFSYNMLMDTYIKQNDYASAAKIAVLPMLQEDCENLITKALSMYACHKYLENPDTWQKPPEPVENKEEIKVRVRYLRNPFFDDHFDLTDPYDLVGKTLAFQGKFLNNALGRTSQLRGLILYKKYQKAAELMKQWENGIEENVVYDEVFDLIERDNKNVLNEQMEDKFNQLMPQINEIKQKNLCKDNLTEALENNVKCAIENQHDIDIKDQLQKFKKWELERISILDKQIIEITQKAKLESINKIKEDLETQEEFLTFFENEEKIELKIEEKERIEKDAMDRLLRRPDSKRKLKRMEEEAEYIPPKI